MTYTKPAILSDADAAYLLNIHQARERWQLVTIAHHTSDGTMTKTPIFVNVSFIPHYIIAPLHVLNSELTPQALIDGLRHAISMPRYRSPARPLSITLDDPELLAWLKPSADKLAIDLGVGYTNIAHHHLRHIDSKLIAPTLDYTQAEGVTPSLLARVFEAAQRFAKLQKDLQLNLPIGFDLFRIERPELPPLYALTELAGTQPPYIVVTQDPVAAHQCHLVAQELDQDGDFPLHKINLINFYDEADHGLSYTRYHNASAAHGWDHPLIPMFSDHDDDLPSLNALLELELGMCAITHAIDTISHTHLQHPSAYAGIDHPHSITFEHLGEPVVVTLPVNLDPALKLTPSFDPSLSVEHIEDLGAWSLELVTRYQRTSRYRRHINTFPHNPPQPLAELISVALSDGRCDLSSLQVSSVKHAIMTVYNTWAHRFELELSDDLLNLFYELKHTHHIDNPLLVEALTPFSPSPHSLAFHRWLKAFLDDSDDPAPYGFAPSPQSTPQLSLSTTKPTKASVSKPKKKAKNKQQRTSRKKNRKK